MTRTAWILGLGGATALACVVALAAQTRRERPRSIAVDDPRVWPGPDAPLRVAGAMIPPSFGLHRIYIDAGHGASGNSGNTSCFCVREEDFTLDVSRALADALESTGHFEVRLSRYGDQPVEYAVRVEDAALWGAEAFVSLHSDVRGKFSQWSPREGTTCPMSASALGFAVLWSDEGDADLVSRRVRLARSTSRRMRDAGFVAYDGATYDLLYEADATTPGVFVDRHPALQRIFVLWRTPMPAVLVETHHALHPREAERWDEPRTLDAFASAMTMAFVELLADPGAPPMH